MADFMQAKPFNTQNPFITQQPIIPQQPLITATPAIPQYNVFQQPSPAPAVPQDKALMASMNDPYQINSLLDVIFNSAAIKKKYGDDSLASHLHAAWDMFNDYTIQPIAKGNFAALGLNALNSLNELVGLPSNVIKALTIGINEDADKVDYDLAAQLVANSVIPNNQYVDYEGKKHYIYYGNGQTYNYTDRELKVYQEIVNSGRTVNPYKLTTGERVKAALGIGDYGQLNYSYKTGGGWVPDMLLEILSDPVTWVTLGAGAAAGAVGKTSINVAQAAFKDIEATMLRKVSTVAEREFVEGLLKNVAEGAESKIFQKEVINYLRQKSVTMSLNEDGIKWITNLLGDAVKTADTGNTWAINNLADAMTVALYKGGDATMSYTAPMVRDLLQETMQAVPNKMSVNVLKILDPIEKASNAVESVLTKAALTPSGIYPIFKLVKKTPAVARWIMDKLNAGAEAYANKLGDWSILTYEDGLKSYQKTAKTIGDALSDEDKLLLGVDYEKRFGKRIAADETFFGDFFEQVNESNVDEMIGTFNKYMEDAHQGAKLVDIINAAKKVLADHPETQLQLQKYIDHLEDYGNRLFQLADQAGVTQKSKQILQTISLFGSKEMPIVQDIIFARNVQKYLTPENMVRDLEFANLVAAIEQTKEEVSNMLTRFVLPVRTLTMQANEMADGFLTRVTALYDKYFRELDEYAMQFDPKTMTWDFQTDRALIDGLNNEYRAFTDALRNIDTKFFSNGDKFVLNHSSMKTLAREVYPDTNTQAAKIIKAVEKVSSLTPQLKNDKLIEGHIALNTDFVNEPSFKAIFGNIDLFNTDAIDEWLSQFHDIFKLVDPKSNKRLIPQSPDSLRQMIYTFFNTPDESEYYYGYAKFNQFLQNLLDTITSHPEAAASLPEEYPALLRELMQDIDKISPENRLKTSQLVPVWTTLYQYKQEQMASLVEILTHKDGIEFATLLSKQGDVGVMLRDILQNTTDLELQTTIHNIIDPIDQYYATKTLFQRISAAPIDENTRIGITSAMHKFFDTDPQILRIDIEQKLDQMVASAETFIQQTKQASESLSLDTFFEKNIDLINEFRASINLKPLTKEQHIAIDDTITDYILLRELANGDQDLQKLFDANTRFVVFDIESLNAEQGAMNIGHQFAITTYDGNTPGGFIQNGLKKEVLEKNMMPDKELLNKYFDPAKYTDEQQITEYLRTRAGDAETEEDLFFDMISELYKNVKDTYDPVAKRYGAAFVTHNGEAFDKKLIESKIRQYNMYDRLNKAGIDVTFLQDVPMLDTLKIMRKKHDYFYVTQDDRSVLKAILSDYADDMVAANSNKLFSAYDQLQMVEMRKALNSLAKNSDETQAAIYNQLREKLGNISDTFASIREQNKEYARTPVAKMLFEGPLADDTFETAERKIEFMKKAFKDIGLTDEEIEKRYGDFTNLNASSILAAQGDYQTIAYKIRRNVELIDAWFVGSSIRIGKLTELEAQQMNGVAYALRGIEKRVYHIDMYTKYYDRMKELTAIMLQDKRFAFLKNLRTENLNVPSQWAVFSYLASKYDKDTSELLRTIFGVTHVNKLSQHDKELYTLLVGNSKMNRYRKAYSASEWISDNLSETIQYAKDYERMLRLDVTLDEFNKTLGKNSLFDGGSQLTKKALIPAAHLMENLEEAYRFLENLPNGEKIAYEFYKQERQAADDTATYILKGFLNQDADNMAHWLASSNGFVVYRNADLAAAEHEGFLAKTLTDEYLKANIEVLDDGEYTWVYLNKKAGLRASVSNDRQTITYYVNGIEKERFNWAQNDVSRVSAGYNSDYIEVSSRGIPNQLHKAENMLYYMTEGRSGSSMYEIFKQTNLQETMMKMPTQMRKNFYSYKELTAPAFWGHMQFNHSVLGTTATRKQFISNASDNMARMLSEATVKRTEEQGSKLVYAAAMFDEFSKLAPDLPGIGEIAVKNPQAIVDYFKGHPEYTMAVLVEDKKMQLGFKVMEIPIDSVHAVKKALDMGARIMTIPEFHKSWEVLNQNIWSDTGMSVWQKIVRVYKVGYLSTPGTWMRNALDSFIKNMVVTGENPPTTAKYYLAAWKDIDEYNTIIEDLYSWGKGRIPDPEEIAKYFEGYKGNITAERYEYLSKFFNDAVAGGEAAVFRKHAKVQQEEYMSALLEAGNITPDIAKQWRMKRDFNALTAIALNPMNRVERVARLAEYDMLSSKGYSATEAIALIEKTHYAYSVKSELEQTMELIIPFYTFASRNLNFWMGMIEENPVYFSYLRDVLEPAWNLEQYNPEELEGNHALQTSVLAGNVPLYGDYVLKTSFSFMDALAIMTDFADQVDSRIFAPVQTMINIGLQGASDESYRKGNDALSNWLQETFGLKVTPEQLRAKYGEWADEYMKLYPYRVSGMDGQSNMQKLANAMQYVPLVGTIIQRLMNDRLYYDGEGASQLLYLAGVAGKITRWDKEAEANKATKLYTKISSMTGDNAELRKEWTNILQEFGYLADTNIYTIKVSQLQSMWNALAQYYYDNKEPAVGSQIYDMLQSDDDNIWLYSRIKTALGYADKSLGDLPQDVKETIFALMHNQTPATEVHPLFQDGESIPFMWKTLLQKNGLTNVPFEKIPTQKYNDMILEIAKGAVVAIRVMDMLQNDPESRYTYAVAKNKLGYKGVKLTQLPTDVLEVIEGAMVNHIYMPSEHHGTAHHYQSVVPGLHGRPDSTYAAKTFSGFTPYDTHKGVYPNYNQAFPQFRDSHVYEDNYTQFGTSRMALMMRDLNPKRMQYRVHYMANLMKY